MNGKVISGPAAILILFLFFLPWVAVSCDGLPKSEFSGLQLATEPDLNGDPIFFVIPVAAVVALLLLASTLWKPSWETNANWGLVIASLAGLLVFLLKWLQLRGQNNGNFEVTILPALWVTVAALLGIGLGAVFDLLQLSKQQTAAFAVPTGGDRVKAKPSQAAPVATPRPVPPSEQAINYTWVDEGAFSAGSNATIVDDGSSRGNPNLTIVDDDHAASAVQSKQTLLDDDMAALGHPAFLAPDVDEEDAQATAVSSSAAKRVEPTEVLHFAPKMVAWLVIGNGEREGEQFQLKADTTIGRDPDSDIFINDTALSALHVRVQLVNGRYVATDQNSTNGLYVFDARNNSWERQDQIPLQEGTQIKLGRTVLHFITLNVT